MEQMKKMIKERLKKLREYMEIEKIDTYIIFDGDYHCSEYISEHFKGRQYITGFTGSAGLVIISKKEADLWTDGRYFLQGERQLKGTGIKLFKDGEKGVPTPKEYLEGIAESGAVIAFDGKTTSAKDGAALEEIAKKKGATVKWEIDLLDKVWENRPPIENNSIYEHEIEFSGKTYYEKAEEIKKSIEGKGDILIISALDDIAWLLNLRGNDIKYIPLFMAYLIISKEKVTLFVADKNIETIRKIYPQIDIFEYNYISEFIRKEIINNRILIDEASVNYGLFKDMASSNEVIKISNSDFIKKHIKNHIEVENMKKAHLLDGIAVTKFIYKLKKAVARGELITEIEAGEMLESLRKLGVGYKGPSFEPIIAYGENGAIIHYSAEEGNNAILQQKSFVLLDTGGQYVYGTTDVTRTVALGELTYEEKEDYTAVLRGHIAVAMSKFPAGISGDKIDAFARQKLWAIGKDYNHGTGHGVGCFLNIHEGPTSIRKKNSSIIEKDMIVSNEPGVYMEGEYGIRLENVIHSMEIQGNNGFLCFENLTLVPFEREAILEDLLSLEEKEYLNNYNYLVRQRLRPYLDKEENEWLDEVTRAI